MIGTQLAHYKILEKLGEGGMGAVYLAKDTSLDREVAIKVLPPRATVDPQGRERFEREARLVASLNHPNIVTIHAVEAAPTGAGAEDVRFLVMERVDGESLAELLSHRAELSLDEIFDVAIPLADAVAAAHAKGVTHRDLKPANVMLTAEGRVKVLDFGLAKLLDPGFAEEFAEAMTLERDDSLTAAGAVLGTYPYMSPEQVEAKPLDHRSDIFSLGVVLFEMATGRRPFAGESSAALISSILKDEPPSVNEVNDALPGHLGRIIRRCLEKDPEHRLQSALDLRNELEALRREIDLETSHSVASATAERWTAPRGRSRSWVVAGALAVAVLAAGLWWRQREVPASARQARGQPTVAVLPFQNLTDDDAVAYLRMAVPDEITTTLSRASNLSIRPFSMTSAYGAGGVQLAEAGRQLGVGNVVTGQYYRELDQLNLTLEAIEVEGNRVLWRDTITVSVEDLLSLRSQVVSRVRDGLLPRLGVAATADGTRPTNAGAYDLYLRSLALTTDTGGNRPARAMLEESLEYDPDYAPAWAELSNRLHRIGSYETIDLEAARSLYAEAEVSAREALRLDPALAGAAQRLVVLEVERGRLEEAYDLARELVERRPDSAEAHFASSYVLRYGGLLDQAIEACEAARSIDPSNRRFRSCAIAFSRAGRHQEAREFLALDGGSEWTRDNATMVSLREGKAAEARAVMEFGNMTSAHRQYIMACLSGEPRQEIDRRAQATVEVFETLVDAEQHHWIAAAMSYCGNPDLALGLLRRGIDGGYCSYPSIDTDPLFERARQLPAFAEVRAAGVACHDRFLAHIAG